MKSVTDDLIVVAWLEHLGSMPLETLELSKTSKGQHSEMGLRSAYALQLCDISVF